MGIWCTTFGESFNFVLCLKTFVIVKYFKSLKFPPRGNGHPHHVSHTKDWPCSLKCHLLPRNIPQKCLFLKNLTFIKFLLRTKHYAKPFAFIISFNIQNFLMVDVQFISDFISKKIEYYWGQSLPANNRKSPVRT